MEKKDIIVIGIAGGTGSGKTTITRKIEEHFRDDVTVIYHDDYYKARHDLSYEERVKLNYDHPAAFDTELMIRDIAALKSGVAIDCPVYDYAIYDRTDQTKTVVPSRVIVVEGILIFHEKELRDLMDIKLFVDADADVRILRRILRDVKERGRSLDSVIGQYLGTVKPMHEAFVEPSKRYLRRPAEVFFRGSAADADADHPRGVLGGEPHRGVDVASYGALQRGIRERIPP